MSKTRFKPMLAATAKQIEDIQLPCYASPKLDGVRAIIIDGTAYSRSMKPIPNQFIQKFFSNGEWNNLDGELIVGNPTDKNCYRNTVSAVMSIEGEPNFTFFVFDDPFWDSDFYHRLRKIQTRISMAYNIRVIPHCHNSVFSLGELIAMEQLSLSQGYEGLITRSFDHKYKQGRSTIKEQGMVKLKRFMDSEAIITGLEELMHNDNEATINEIGHTSRSQHQSGLRAAGTLGALIVRDVQSGIEFRIGTGFDQETRNSIWETGSSILGHIVKYKFFPVGVKEKPRHPVFLGFRAEEDMP